MNDASPDGNMDRQLDVDVRLRVGTDRPFVGVSRRFKAVVFVTASANGVSAASRDGLIGTRPLL
jgi:hypothetical protein